MIWGCGCDGLGRVGWQVPRVVLFWAWEWDVLGWLAVGGEVAVLVAGAEFLYLLGMGRSLSIGNEVAPTGGCVLMGFAQALLVTAFTIA